GTVDERRKVGHGLAARSVARNRRTSAAPAALPRRRCGRAHHRHLRVHDPARQHTAPAADAAVLARRRDAGHLAAQSRAHVRPIRAAPARRGDALRRRDRNRAGHQLRGVRRAGPHGVRRAAAGRAGRGRRGRRDRRLQQPPVVRLREVCAMSAHADVFVIGAGPAGLTAAYCLTKESPSVIVIEKDPVYVGGISRTVEYNVFMFDIGGHRFFSKSKEVVDLWREILPDDFIERPRLSRIYYGGKYYSYPLSAFEALSNLGLFTSAACMLSFAYAKLLPIESPANFH